MQSTYKWPEICLKQIFYVYDLAARMKSIRPKFIAQALTAFDTAPPVPEEALNPDRTLRFLRPTAFITTGSGGSGVDRILPRELAALVCEYEAYPLRHVIEALRCNRMGVVLQRRRRRRRGRGGPGTGTGKRNDSSVARLETTDGGVGSFRR